MSISDLIYFDFLHDEHFDFKDKTHMEIENIINDKNNASTMIETLQDRKYNLQRVINYLSKYYNKNNMYLIKYSIVDDQIKLLDCLYLTPSDINKYSCLL